MSLISKIAMVGVGAVAGIWAQQNYPTNIPNLKDYANQTIDSLKKTVGK